MLVSSVFVSVRHYSSICNSSEIECSYEQNRTPTLPVCPALPGKPDTVQGEVTNFSLNPAENVQLIMREHKTNVTFDFP